MGKKIVLGLLVLLYCLLNVRVGQAEVGAPNAYPVHNLNTGLNYTTIQEAVDTTETLDGHTIFVENGIYLEHLVVEKSLTLRGESKDTTIIDGSGTGAVVSLNTSSNVTGFTIRNGEYGIQVHTSAVAIPAFTGHRIEGNRIMNNRYGGLSLRGCADNTISNNIVLNNTLFGIHLWTAGNNTLINNTVMNNRHGIDFYGNSNHNILRNNNMTDNRYNFGLILREETRLFFSGTPSETGIVNDVDPSNTVNGRPIYYMVNRTNEQVPSDAGYIWLNNCTNITINGCNLSNNIQGILLLFTNNASIINNNITDNAYGIYVGVGSVNNTLIGNILKDNMNGIFLDDVTKLTTMRNNNISGGQMNFGVSPDIARHISSGSDLMNDIDASNMIEGKPIIFWINQHDKQVPSNAGHVTLINSTNIRIENLVLSNNVQNVFLLASNDTIIANCSLTNSVYGIVISDCSWYDFDAGMLFRFYSSNTTIEDNTLVENGVGITIRSDESTVKNNTLDRNPLGICLAGTSKSTISENAVTGSNTSAIGPSHGPELLIFYYPAWPWEYSRELAQLEIGGIIVGGKYNLICGNTVTDCSVGIQMYEPLGRYFGQENKVFHNNFIDNKPYQALFPPRGSNYFDNGYPSGGNYWSDNTGPDLYSGSYQNETGSDGIVDTSYFINYDNIDRYPLAGMFNSFNVTYFTPPLVPHYGNVTVISNSSISDFVAPIWIEHPEVIFLEFKVTGEQGSTGFCRVSFPTAMMNDTYHVFVNGTEVPYILLPCSNADDSYLYFTYTHSTKEVVIIPELPIFFILPLFMIVTLLVVIVFRKRRIDAISIDLLLHSTDT